jgi:basic membrane protein A and related proteins
MGKTKRFSALALITVLGLTAAACGDDEESTTTEAPAATEAPAGSEAPAASEVPAEGSLKLGIAYDTGGRGDGTFNDAAAAGADKAKTELGATVDELEATSDEDRKPNLETLTANGDNPIITVGFLWSDVLAEIAAANPDTTYAIVDGFVEAPNVRVLGFAENEGSFLVGAAAALKSESGHIGFIGGQEIDLIKKFEAGYIAGAKAVNPDIIIESAYLGAAGDNNAWAAPDKAKEIALGWYADGADIIYTAAGGSGAGTIEAAVEADAWAIGVDSDQYLTVGDPEAQKHILTSMLKRVDTAVFETAKAFSEGDTAGGIFTYDLSVDGVGYSTSGGYLDDIVDQLEAFKAQIIAGEIVVPTTPEG